MFFIVVGSGWRGLYQAVGLGLPVVVVPGQGGCQQGTFGGGNWAFICFAMPFENVPKLFQIVELGQYGHGPDQGLCVVA